MGGATADALPEEVVAALTGVCDLCARCIGQRLRGVLLHGSAAMGCFRAGLSDLDILLVAETPLPPHVRHRFSTGLLGLGGRPHPIEISVIDSRRGAVLMHPTPFDFHYSEAHRAATAERIATGPLSFRGHAAGHDADLAAHVAMARARGLALIGSAPRDLLPAVRVCDLLHAVAADLRWAMENARSSPLYAVLNACRAIALAESGVLLSKAEGVAAALPRLAVRSRSTARRAGKIYAGETGALDPAQVTSILDRAIEFIGVRANRHLTPDRFSDTIIMVISQFAQWWWPPR